MHELLPILLGAIFGTVGAAAPVPGPRSAWFVAGCVVAGALASWMNGEVTSSLAGLFISLDALLAWCGAATVFLALRLYNWSATR